MSDKPEKRSLKFKIGLGILLVNTPLCYILIAIFSGMAARRRDPNLLMISGIIFVLSWVFFALGTMLAGPGAILIIKNMWRKILRRKKT